jgi:hypothetical protein
VLTELYLTTAASQWNVGHEQTLGLLFGDERELPEFVKHQLSVLDKRSHSDRMRTLKDLLKEVEEKLKTLQEERATRKVAFCIASSYEV